MRAGVYLAPLDTAGASGGYTRVPATPLELFRSRFPILGRRVYVNSCSQGALSTDVQAALGAFTT